MPDPRLPVLVIGGAGTVGVHVARALRRLAPDQEILIGGRNMERAGKVAEEIGTASAVRVDLAQADLDIPHLTVGAVAMLVKDDNLNALRWAQRQTAGYLSISSALFEMAPEVGQFANAQHASPVIMASNWLAGVSTLSALNFATDFTALDGVRIMALLDDEDVGGPAAHADYERQTSVTSSALVLEDGQWQWLSGVRANGAFTSVDGQEFASQIFSNLDVISLASIEGVKSARFEFAVGETSSRRQGNRFSTEIIFELRGLRKDGRRGAFRYELIHSDGQAPLTGVGVAVALEHLLGLAGRPRLSPGLYLPHNVIDPEYMIRRLTEAGAQFARL